MQLVALPAQHGGKQLGRQKLCCDRKAAHRHRQSAERLDQAVAAVDEGIQPQLLPIHLQHRAAQALLWAGQPQQRTDAPHHQICARQAEDKDWRSDVKIQGVVKDEHPLSRITAAQLLHQPKECPAAAQQKQPPLY